jgi:hypothetical protein
MSARIVTLRGDRSAPAVEQLRERAEAIAAEFDPIALPGGDAGLIEAERRLRELRHRNNALRREFAITMEVEREVILPTIREAEERLCEFIENTVPETRTGAIVKLRYLAGPDYELLLPEGVARSVEQVLALLEREARP